MALRHDATLVRSYGPAIAKALATNIAGEVRSLATPTRLPAGVQETTYDPFDPATAADPYPAYRSLLASGPVHYNRKRDLYILTRHADVKGAAKADAVMSSSDGPTFVKFTLPMLLSTDRPQHTAMRRKVHPGFTRGALESWQPMIDTLARDLVDDVIRNPGCDVVSTLSVPMPMGMITHIMGVPSDDDDYFRRWSTATVHIADINLSPRGLAEMVPCLVGVRQLHSFIAERIASGALLGSDTVLGRLVDHSGTDELSHTELFSFALLLLLAGNETTTNMLSSLFITLAERPDVLETLRNRPELIPFAIEEQLRIAAPIQGFYRTTLADYPVGRTVIPARSRVLLAWGAANHDPRVYDDPDDFQVERNPVGHVAFGYGIHMCLGAQLARLEGQAVLREIVDRVRKVELTTTPTWSTNASLRGPTHLGVRLVRRK